MHKISLIVGSLICAASAVFAGEPNKTDILKFAQQEMGQTSFAAMHGFNPRYREYLKSLDLDQTTIAYDNDPFMMMAYLEFILKKAGFQTASGNKVKVNDQEGFWEDFFRSVDKTDDPQPGDVFIAMTNTFVLTGIYIGDFTAFNGKVASEVYMVEQGVVSKVAFQKDEINFFHPRAVGQPEKKQADKKDPSKTDAVYRPRPPHKNEISQF